MALIKCPDCGREVSDRADKCPGCARSLIQDAELDTCDQEPCKSAREAYRDQAARAVQAASELPWFCSVLTFLQGVFLTLLFLLALVFAAIVACHALNWLPLVCQGLYATAAIIAVALAAVAVVILVARRQIRMLHLHCRVEETKMVVRYLDMARDCPPDCLLPRINVQCSCP